MAKSKKNITVESPQADGRSWRGIALLCLISVVLRAVLGVLLHESQTVSIDENLYTNIARSLAFDGSLAYRAQPTNYPYLLYPILLVPVYWMNRLFGGDVYRYIQVFNSILMCSSLIPIYLFAADFTKDKKKAMTAALLTAIMPDLILTGYSMAENIIWPLSCLLLFFGYRMFSGKSCRYGYFTAATAGLLFFAKPGAVLVGVALLGWYTVQQWKHADKRKHCIGSILVLLGIIALIYLLHYIMLPEAFSLVGLYEKQTDDWSTKSFFVALEAIAVFPLLFAAACGGIFLILPFVYAKDFADDQKHFLYALSAGIAAVFVGTAFFVVPFRWEGGMGRIPLHLRYCAMFVPAYVIFSLHVGSHNGKNQNLYRCVLALSVLLIFPGVWIGFPSKTSSTIDSLALSAFASSPTLNGTVFGILCTVLALLPLLALLPDMQKGWQPKKHAKFAVIFYALMLLLNTGCAYAHTNLYIDPTIRQDALEINDMLNGSEEEFLGITQSDFISFDTFWLDSRLNEPMQMVTFPQMYVAMAERQGIYQPFVPQDQPPIIHSHETPNASRFIMMKGSEKFVEFNPSVSLSATANGHFNIVNTVPGERWVDSMLYGTDSGMLQDGDEVYISVFNKNRVHDGQISLILHISGSGKLSVQGTEIDLPAEPTAIRFIVPETEIIVLKPVGGNATIESYYTEIL